MANFTPDEVIGIINHSGFSTVLVEGSGDLFVYRRLIPLLQPLGAALQEAGGKPNLITVFERRHELIKPCVSICDKDELVENEQDRAPFVGPIVFTDGYSIENDLIQDGDIMSLLSEDELLKFLKELDNFILWYAAARLRSQHGASVWRVLDEAGELSEWALERVGSVYNNPLAIEFYRQRFLRAVRGKSLLDLLLRQLGRQGRFAVHNGGAILDHCALRKGPKLMRLFDEVQQQLNAMETT